MREQKSKLSKRLEKVKAWRGQQPPEVCEGTGPEAKGQLGIWTISVRSLEGRGFLRRGWKPGLEAPSCSQEGWLQQAQARLEYVCKATEGREERQELEEAAGKTEALQ